MVANQTVIAAPFEWPVDDGGNGHFYDYVPGTYSWSVASALSENTKHQDLPGHLTTITSREEKNFLTSQFIRRLGEVPLGWLGGYQDRGAEDYREPNGGWRWVTDEPWDYTNWWRSVGFPDNFNGNQDFIRTQGDFLWDDIEHAPSGFDVRGYFIEFEPPKPPAIPGDFDGNQVLDVLDVNLLMAGLRAGTNLVFDLVPNGELNHQDLVVWVEELKNTYFGDANLDGEFNSTDLIQTFKSGKFEDGIADNANWEDGDWNGDREFDTTDFIIAFQSGGYEIGPRGDVLSVPEPSGATLCLLLVLLAQVHHHHHHHTAKCA
ncbi:MAG: hypothetical protein KDA87_08645 [Planctomycetales bacterium]|nr:hypothetical protein [Planctomycetales bacterium]